MTVLDLGQTLAVSTVENFLDAAEVSTVLHAVEADPGIRRARAKAANADGRRNGGYAGGAQHEIPGMSDADARRVFEPRGRVQVGTLPRRVEAILTSATERAMPALRRLFPATTSVRPWTYVEYAPEQYITPHVDGIAPKPTTWPRQVAGLGITIQRAEDGGEFYIETTASDELWDDSAETGSLAWAREGADESSPWFRAMRRTRWVVAPAEGTLACYGSQLVHGTMPVRSGRAIKLLSWLIQAPEDARE